MYSMRWEKIEGLSASECHTQFLLSALVFTSFLMLLLQTNLRLTCGLALESLAQEECPTIPKNTWQALPKGY